MPKTKDAPTALNPWTGIDDQLMVTAAHRYCLGRQSYIVGSCIDWMLARRAQFTRNTICVMVRDTIEALQDGHAGSATCDVPGWKRFCEVLLSEMSEEDRQWVRSDVAHRDKPWPLDETTETPPSDARMTNINSLRKARWKAWRYMRNAGGRVGRRERMQKKYRRAMLRFIELDWKIWKATAKAEHIAFMNAIVNDGLTIKPRRST